MGAALAVALLIISLVAWAAAPRSQGVDDLWEAPWFDGTVLGGRALVAKGSNKALDLTTGTTITIGSVSGGRRYVAADRLLIVGSDRIDAAALDANQRWTWTAPADTTDLSLVAASTTGIVARHCSAPDACALTGIGPSGSRSWSMPMPPSVTGAPVTAPGGGLPAYAILPAGDRTWLLIDPATSRAILRVADQVDVAPDGVITLQEKAPDGHCTVINGPTIDRLTSTNGACHWPPTHERGLLIDTEITTSSSQPGLWPLPTVHRLEAAGDHPFAIEDREPLTLLRADDEHVTVRESDRIVRYRVTGR